MHPEAGFGRWVCHWHSRTGDTAVQLRFDEPVGNALNHNLLRELLLSTALVPPDLAVLDGDRRTIYEHPPG
ncbi:MAG TPA: hypothetical protein VE198_17815 [Actinoallomurus sp.]|nr:hypothetical protein [Actinoallomurus sp.]